MKAKNYEKEIHNLKQNMNQSSHESRNFQSKISDLESQLSILNEQLDANDKKLKDVQAEKQDFKIRYDEEVQNRFNLENEFQNVNNKNKNICFRTSHYTPCADLNEIGIWICRGKPEFSPLDHM